MASQPAKKPDAVSRPKPAPLDSDAAGAIYNLMLAAMTADELNQRFLRSLILGEVRRIIRRGE